MFRKLWTFAAPCIYGHFSMGAPVKLVIFHFILTGKIMPWNVGNNPKRFGMAVTLVRFPDPLGKWVGRTNPLRAGNFTSEASGTENVD